MNKDDVPVHLKDKYNADENDLTPEVFKESGLAGCRLSDSDWG